MKTPVPQSLLSIVALAGLAALGCSPPEPSAFAGLGTKETDPKDTGTSSFVSEVPPSIAESFVYQSNRGISVQCSIPDGSSSEVFNHASGTSDAFFQFTQRPGSDGTFQILVYADSGDALLTRTFVIPGYAPVITVPPKARVVIKDPIDEDSDSITGLMTIG